MPDDQRIIQQFERPLKFPFATPMLYRIKLGDTLTSIIKAHYDINPTDKRFSLAIAHIMYFNPAIKHPDHICAGDLLRIIPFEPGPEPFCKVPDDFYTQHRAPAALQHHLEPLLPCWEQRFESILPKQKFERDMFWVLSWMHENYDYLANIGFGSGFNVLGNLTEETNNALIAEVKTLYQQYKSGVLTKGQYDYRRQKALQTFKDRVGPFDRLLFSGKTGPEAIRIARTKSVPATAKIDRNLTRLAKLSSVAKYGGILLSAAGIGMGCYNIAQANTRNEKNEIFVETLSSTIAGAAGTVAVSVFIASNPVGWVVGLTLGVGVAAGSYGVGKGFSYLYDRFGKKHDLVRMGRLDRLCR
ncbi:MAG: hypothetical protein P8104_00145 [Gammaproteobacteria bacterium]